MSNTSFVVDANVFAKLLIEESDSRSARKFFTYCVEQEKNLLAPSLFTYELMQIASYYDYPTQQTLASIADYTSFCLDLVELSSGQWELALQITKSGHAKSGFPAIYDSCYHALAIDNDCTFITADRKHAAKTINFGHLELLSDWEPE